MCSKPVLMIHNITEDIFDLPLADYVLTFDDGTLDHFEYYERFKAINTQKKYFIIADCIGKPGYMDIQHLEAMNLDPLVTIGGHSYDHTDMRHMKLIHTVAHIKQDTEKMLEWFKTHMGFEPSEFCFPYNYNPHGMYGKLLEHYGIIHLYGHERIPVEMLLQSDYQPAFL
jgi:peptidoglycan/xylan/chitin deacetylase (PgdA/CDA1 family)